MTVTVVDDVPTITRFVRVVVEHHLKCQTAGYHDGKSFLAAGEPPPGCVVLGVCMPGMSGIEVLREMKTRGWDIPVITMSAAYTTEAMRDETSDIGTPPHLEKPFSIEHLLDEVRDAMAIPYVVNAA